MPSPRQMVIATLRDLTKQCLDEQANLVIITGARRQIEFEAELAREEEMETFKRIKALKSRIGYEMAHNGKTLGVQVMTAADLARMMEEMREDDDEGEEWKHAGGGSDSPSK